MLNKKLFYRSKKHDAALKCSKKIVASDRLWLFSILNSIAILYLGLVWKTTANIDYLVTDVMFWAAIIWLLWKKRDKLSYDSDPISNFIGLSLLGLVLSKAITIYNFESVLISLLPIISLFALALIASGFKGLKQYAKELFFAWFLFFPTGVIGHFIDDRFHITILNAKVATYLLYYLGFNVVSQNNEVILSLPELGVFKAIVDYPCAGVPMILLILKLALLTICCLSPNRKQQILIPSFSLVLGFMLGVLRVSILTLLIPSESQFEYWHGSQGSQVFSTLAIIIFSVFSYQMLQKDRPSIIN